VDIGTDLAGVHLKIPFTSAAMTSVTHYDMALALAKEFGLGVLPVRLPVEEQEDIVRRIKDYEMSFVEKPIKARADQKVGDLLKLIKQHGHSKIPVVDEDNYFIGIFDQEHYWEINPRRSDPVTDALVPFNNGNGDIAYVCNPDVSVERAKALLTQHDASYLVVLDRAKRLKKLAFKKDVEQLQVASAISTHGGWRERVEANIGAGVDMLVIDTSDGFSDYVDDVVKEYKAEGYTPPICAGNIVTYEGARDLMEAGADIVKVGMSSGSICTTRREKAVGRAPMTALLDVGRARDDYFRETHQYVPIIIDGGIAGPADMVVALTVADAMMLGGYFNKFFEAAGEKLDASGNPTTDESEMKKVVTYGEGSEHAQNFDRYQQVRRFWFPEGEYGSVLYGGRLKPQLEQDTRRIKAALVNAGCMTLAEYRARSIIELMSPASQGIISTTHDMDVKGD
jgi:IMP dehydrogenase